MISHIHHILKAPYLVLIFSTQIHDYGVCTLKSKGQLDKVPQFEKSRQVVKKIFQKQVYII